MLLGCEVLLVNKVGHTCGRLLIMFVVVKQLLGRVISTTFPLSSIMQLSTTSSLTTW